MLTEIFDNTNQQTSDNELNNDIHFGIPIPLIDVSLDVEPRQWVYGTSLVRGMLSVLGGTGGVGKSSYAHSVSLSIAMGRPLLAFQTDEQEHLIYEPKGAVWYYSLEDPMDELRRSIAAQLRHYCINPREVWNNLYIQSGRDYPLLVAKRGDSGNIERIDVTPIVAAIKERNIVLMVVDPFANSFEGGEGAESGSDTMKIVLDQWRLVAHQANCAVWLIHHFRKGGMGGDADSFRGSSVIQNAARIMETLTTMTVDDAKDLKISQSERRSHVRLENAKVNLSAAPADGQWFKFSGVPLANGSPKYPRGDVIGVLSRWKPNEVVLDWATVRDTLDKIDAGVMVDDKQEYYQYAPQAGRWAGAVIQDMMQLSRTGTKKQLDDWTGTGMLLRRIYISPTSRKKVEILRVNPDAKLRLQQQIEGRI